MSGETQAFGPVSSAPSSLASNRRPFLPQASVLAPPWRGMGLESGPSQSRVQGCDTSMGRREAQAGGQTVGYQAQDFPTQSSALTPAVSRIPTVTAEKLREARDVPNSQQRQNTSPAPLHRGLWLLSPQYNRHVSARGTCVDT